MTDINNFIRAGEEARQLQQRLINAEALLERMKVHLAILQCGPALTGSDYAQTAIKIAVLFDSGDLKLLTSSPRFAGLPVVIFESGAVLNPETAKALLQL